MHVNCSVLGHFRGARMCCRAFEQRAGRWSAAPARPGGYLDGWRRPRRCCLVLGTYYVHPRRPISRREQLHHKPEPRHGEWFQIGPRDISEAASSSGLPRPPPSHVPISACPGSQRPSSSKVATSTRPKRSSSGSTQTAFDLGEHTEMARRCDSSTSIARCLGLGN